MILFMVGTFVTPLIALAVPEPAGSSRTGFTFDLYIYVSVAITLAFIGASILFIMGFRGFTTRLKQAYGTLCLGLMLYGIAQLQIPILT